MVMFHVKQFLLADGMVIEESIMVYQWLLINCKKMFRVKHFSYKSLSVMAADNNREMFKWNK